MDDQQGSLDVFCEPGPQDSTFAGFLILKDFRAHQDYFRRLALEVAPALMPGDAKKLTTMTQFSGAIKPDRYQNILQSTVTRGGMVPIVP